jgi:anthranilate phosphoribosyltransferase
MIQEAISKIVEGHDISEQEAGQVMEEIMSGESLPSQFGAFVTALRIKGEAPEEIAGMARVMQSKALQVTLANDLTVVDTCGTGGDGSNTINVSTISALVVAGAGLKVAKHGNRSITSACGSADVLESSGVKIDLGPDGVKKCIEDVGMGFMFAPVFHPAMKYAGPHRREIGIRTVFNILGPLTNPAKVNRQVLGVSDESLGEKIVTVLGILGSKKALVVNSEDGLDEISICADTNIWELSDGNISRYKISPEDLGITRLPIDSIKVHTMDENLYALNSVLSGEEGPYKDIVLVNAGAALLVGEKVHTLSEGVAMAAESIASGSAKAILHNLVEISQKF